MRISGINILYVSSKNWNPQIISIFLQMIGWKCRKCHPTQFGQIWHHKRKTQWADVCTRSFSGFIKCSIKWTFSLNIFTLQTSHSDTYQCRLCVRRYTGSLSGSHSGSCRGGCDRSGPLHSGASPSDTRQCLRRKKDEALQQWPTEQPRGYNLNTAKACYRARQYKKTRHQCSHSLRIIILLFMFLKWFLFLNYFGK